MRILVVTQYFWPENFRINDLVKEWLQRGYQVTVLTGIPNYPLGKVFDEYRQHPEDFLKFEVADIIRVPIVLRGSSRLSLALNYLSFVFSALFYGTWRLRTYRPDVIFVFEPSPVTVGLPAIWFSKIKKSPVVFWALDLWPDTLEAVGIIRSPFILRLVGHLVRFIYNRCTLILGQSRGFIGSIANYCSDKTKIRYLPNWAEDIFSIQQGIFAPELPYLKHCFTVVFTGNIGEAQDMPSVLDAAVQLKEFSFIRWVIVGDGRKSKWLNAQVISRGLQDRVLMPGRFALDRMPSFFAHADALLVSLKRDPVFSMTIPGKVQSYLMTGIPLLGMLDGEGAAVIKDAQAGLTCDAGDSAGLAKLVLELIAMSPSERKQLGANGKNYARKEFCRSQLMDRLDGLLTEAVVLGNNRSD